MKTYAQSGQRGQYSGQPGVDLEAHGGYYIPQTFIRATLLRTSTSACRGSNTNPNHLRRKGVSCSAQWTMSFTPKPLPCNIIKPVILFPLVMYLHIARSHMRVSSLNDPILIRIKNISLHYYSTVHIDM